MCDSIILSIDLNVDSNFFILFSNLILMLKRINHKKEQWERNYLTSILEEMLPFHPVTSGSWQMIDVVENDEH